MYRVTIACFILLFTGIVWADHVIQLSDAPDRSNPVPLEGATVSDDIYVFILPENDIDQVTFLVNDAVERTEGLAPYDLAGTTSNFDAQPYDSTELVDGAHTVTAEIQLTDGSFEVISASFTVANDVPKLEFDSESVSLTSSESGGPVSSQILLTSSDGSAEEFILTITPEAPWLSTDSDATSTPANITLTADPAISGAGTFSTTLTASSVSGSYASHEVDVAFTVTSESYVLMSSASPARDAAIPLDGTDVDGDIYVFVEPESGISQVRFFVDDPNMSSTPIQIENVEPYDLAGTGADGNALPFDTLALNDGTHNVTALVTLTVGANLTISSDFSVGNNSDTNSPPTASFTENCDDLMCTFDASASSDSDGVIVSHEWDFGDGTTAVGETVSHTYAASGSYIVTLTVTDDDGASSISMNSLEVFDGNASPNASFAADCDGLLCELDASASDDPDGTIMAYEWDFGDGSTGTGEIVSHTYSEAGSFDITLVVFDDEGATGSITKTVTVSTATGCADISTLDCNQIRQVGDLLLNFDGSSGGLLDQNGIGTGFTMVDPPSWPGNPDPDTDAPGYWPEKITVKPSQGRLSLETTAGIQHQDNNNQDNALGVGLNVPSAVVTMKTSVVDLPASPPGGWAQAGLWFGSANSFGRGTTEEDHIKLVVASPSPSQYVLQASLEQGGIQMSATTIDISPDTQSVTLELVANPGSRSVQAKFDLGNGQTTLTVFNSLPDEWFSFDQAGIDPEVATRSHGGVFATHRLAANPIVFHFDSFSLVEDTPSGGDGDFAFDRWEIPVNFPTAMAWGPDDRLYVADLFGTIHAFTLDRANRVVLDDEVINAIPASHGGGRLTLGLTVDPVSTPSNVILWVAHSDGSLNNGQENSGIISEVSGTFFQTVEDRITGLPRAIANHAINHIKFGPDGRLYVAAGGNTGAGAANLSDSEFGDRPEQPLSAAILVADVNDPDFQGQCATPVGEFGIPLSCDVEVYASGLRNSYDIAWHSNGSLYATDNGLGVTGTVPPFTTPPCTEFGDPSFDNPGPQPDLLLRVQQGNYYGHPNPYRDECVFKDGTFQGVSPLPNFTPPMFVLGQNLSANGIIEYKGDAFYSKLMGQLLISNFSVGDNLTRVALSRDGVQVASSVNLTGGFTDPLPLTQDPQGNVYVGELNAGRVTVLEPLPLDPAPVGFWTDGQSLPEAILDANGTGLDGKFYVVGGKTSAGHISSLFIYDPIQDAWSAGAPLPGPAVENPAVTSLDGKLYVFGGSTAPFSGAVTNAAAYDPASNTWSILPPMTTARGGAGAEALNGEIHVVGGMGADGASLDSVEVFDPSTQSWFSGTPLLTRRDNPGTAVLDGNLHVFGGRTRNADGSEVESALSSMEVYDPVSDTWAFGPLMPTGRRAMTVGTISGRAQVIGGESPATSANEEYDPETNSWRILTPMPTSRHGAASATINGAVYVAGGGPTSGSSFSSVHEVFAY